MKSIRILKLTFAAILILIVCFVGATHSIAADTVVPVVTTTGSSNISAFSLTTTLYGQIEFEETAKFNVGFQFWTDANNKYWISCSEGVSSSTSFSETIPCYLLDNTDYYYCAYAQTSDGTYYYGSTLSFTTPEIQKEDSLIEINKDSIPFVEGEVGENITLLNSLLSKNEIALDAVISTDVVLEYDEPYAEKYLYQQFIENYYNDNLLRYSLNIFDAVVYNREESIADFAKTVSVPKDLIHAVAPEKANEALAAVLNGMSYKRYNGAINGVFAGDYKSSTRNTFAFEHREFAEYSNSSMVTKTIDDISNAYNQEISFTDAAEQAMFSYMGTTVWPEIKEAHDDYVYSLNWLSSNTKTSSNADLYNHYYALSRSSGQKFRSGFKFKSDYDALETLTSSTAFESADVLGTVFGAAFDFRNATMDDITNLNIMAANFDRTVAVFQRMHNQNFNDVDFEAVLNTLITKMISGKAGLFLSVAENIRDTMEQYVIKGSLSLMNQKLLNDAYCKLIPIAGIKAVGAYNQATLAIDLTGLGVQVIGNIKDMLNCAIEIKYLFKIENYLRTTINSDISTYSNATTEENAKKVLDDLYLLKMVRLRLNELAKMYFKYQTTSTLADIFGISDSAKGIDIIYQQQIDALVDTSLVSKDFTMEPLSIVSSDNIAVTEAQPQWVRRLTGGINMSGGTFVIDTTGMDDIYIPFINISGGTLTLIGCGEVTIGNVDISSNGTVIIDCTNKVEIDSFVMSNGDAILIGDIIINSSASFCTASFMGNINIHGDFNCGKLLIENDSIVNVMGDFMIKAAYSSTPLTIGSNSSLNVYGDFYLQSISSRYAGKTTTIDGTLFVDGNFVPLSKCSAGYNYLDLNMRSLGSCIIVNGNSSFYTSGQNFSNGKIEFRGDVTGFIAPTSSQTEIRINGDRLQTVTNSTFNDLYIDNICEEGVDVGIGKVLVFGCLYDNARVLNGRFVLCQNATVDGGVYNRDIDMNGWICNEPLVINGNSNALYNMYRYISDYDHTCQIYSTLTINGSSECYKLTVNDGAELNVSGVFELDSNLTVNSGGAINAGSNFTMQPNAQLAVAKDSQLNIAGSFKLINVSSSYASGMIWINGTMKVSGDFNHALGNMTHAYLHLSSDSSHLIVGGNATFYYSTSFQSISKGKLEFKGDITNFYAPTSSETEVRINGDGLQTINDSTFNDVYIDNVSEDGIATEEGSMLVFGCIWDNAKNMTGRIVLCLNATVGEGVYNHDIDFDGWICNDPLIINGNVNFVSNMYQYISGYDHTSQINSVLTLSGNCINYKAKINNGGKITVGGDLKNKTYGELVVNKNGALNVAGSFVPEYYGYSRSSSLTINGTMEVQGNFTTKSGSHITTIYMNDEMGSLIVNGNYTSSTTQNYSKGKVEFRGNVTGFIASTSSETEVRINGDTLQTVSGQFNDLHIDNVSEGGVDVGGVNLYGCMYDNANLIVNAMTLYDNATIDGGIYNYDVNFYDWNCNEPLTINGNVEFIYGNSQPNEINSSLTINGSCFSYNLQINENGTMNVAKDLKITIFGKLIIKNQGTINIAGNFTPEYYGYSRTSSLTINGTMKVQGNFTTKSGSHITTIYMNDEMGSLTVNGNYSSSTTQNYSKGKVEFRGNVTGFIASTSSETQVVLNGDGLQNISSSKFNYLISENLSTDGIKFTSTVTVSTLFNHNQNKFTLYNNGTGSSFNDYDGDGLKDNVDQYPLVGNPCRIELVSNNEDNGTVDESFDSVGGTTVTVNAYEKENSWFVCWQNSEGITVSTTPEYSFVAKGDTTLTAVFFDLILNDPGDIYAGSSVQLTAAISPSSESDTPITWTSSDTRIATVDENGLLTPKMIGRVKITVSTADGKCSSSRLVKILPTNAVITIRNLNGSNEQKIDWWKSYSSATMNLSVQKYNCDDVAYYIWTSSNKRVKVNERGVVTNTGYFSRSATLTLTAYDEDGNVITKSSIKVVFYKFKWQKDRLQTQSIVSDNYLDRNVSEETLDTTTENEFVSLFSYIFEFMEKIFRLLPTR